MPLIDVNSILGPEPPRPPNTTDPAYKTFPQEGKRAWREYITKKQNLKMEALSMGYQPEDLGITGNKDEGQAWKRALGAYGFNDRNYEYDRASGRKRNIATSDMDAQARNEWVPMSASDIAEYDRHQSDGGDWKAAIGRLQSDARGRMQNWAQHNEARGGGIRRDAVGNLYDVGDDGQNIYYDAYGAAIDPRNGQRTGSIYGGQNMTYGAQIGGAGAGQQSGGVTGGAPAPMNQTNAAVQPGYTYMPNADPWGGGGSTGNTTTSYRQPRNTGVSGYMPQAYRQPRNQPPVGYQAPTMFGGY